MQFETVDDDYTGGYTSEEIRPNTSGANGRGIIQVEITSGTLLIQGKADQYAPWFTLKTYTETLMEEIVLVPYFRVIASDTSRAWLEETR